MEPKKLYRILDANFNRAREGLRVLEEVVRFGTDSAGLQRELKHCRHAVTGVLRRFAVSPRVLLGSRDTRRDVGRGVSRAESQRLDLADVFLANLQRVKESLRALEEFSKLVDPASSVKLKETRFRVYALEKRAVPKLEALRDHLPGKNGRGGPRPARGSGHPRRRQRSAASR